MNIHELQAQHPALFAEAKEIGVTAERKRTKAFLGFVKSDDKTASGRAIKAIKDGEDLSDATGEITQLLMAGNRTEAMQSENAEDLGADPKPNTPESDKTTSNPQAQAEAEEAEVMALLKGGK